MSINESEQFVELMTNFQGRLYAFILSLMGDPNSANDILQETNIVLWNKSSEFELGTNFKAWSFRIASFQVMAYRQRCMRDRLIFDDDMNMYLLEVNQPYAVEYAELPGYRDVCPQFIDSTLDIVLKLYENPDRIPEILENP